MNLLCLLTAIRFRLIGIITNLERLATFEVSASRPRVTVRRFSRPIFESEVVRLDGSVLLSQTAVPPPTALPSASPRIGTASDGGSDHQSRPNQQRLSGASSSLSSSSLSSSRALLAFEDVSTIRVDCGVASQSLRRSFELPRLYLDLRGHANRVSHCRNAILS